MQQPAASDDQMPVRYRIQRNRDDQSRIVQADLQRVIALRRVVVISTLLIFSSAFQRPDSLQTSNSATAPA